MNRHLHLTFIEQPTTSRRTAQQSAGGSHDPEGGAVMPPIDDPGGGAVMPPIDDPEGGAVMPPIDDPTGGAIPFAGSATALAVLAAAGGGGCCCGCGGAHAAGATSAQTSAEPPGTFSGFVIVRMARGIVSKAAETLWDLAQGAPPEFPPLPGLRAALELPFAEAAAATARSAAAPAAGGLARAPGKDAVERLPPSEPPHLESRPLIEIGRRTREGLPPTLSRAEAIAALAHLESETATGPYPPLHSLAAYWRVDLRRFPERVDEVVERLAALAEVDLAYRERAALDPSVNPPTVAKPPCDYVPDQGYFQAAPVGVGASEFLAQAGAGSGTLKVCDLEQGWCLAHGDLAGKLDAWAQPIHGGNRADDDGLAAGHHGTAVLGQLAAGGSVQGAASAFGEFLLSSHYRDRLTPEKDFPRTNGHVAAAIVNALPWKLLPGDSPPHPALAKGDVLLLEVQRGLLPAELDPADFDAIRLAVGLGIVVVEAAGNGGFDLDRAFAPDGRSLRRGDARFRDSGAILVGAARAALPHDRLGFSNYGSRVDCFAWGEAVTSCGYGDLSGSDPAGVDFFTNSFSGTSSASPVIAGAAALLQERHRRASGSLLAPSALRALLADPATGTRQGPRVAGAIGVMPDLDAIARAHGLAPVVYLRKNLCDDGTPLALDAEISGSPDLFAWPTPPPAVGATSVVGPQLDRFPAPGKDLLPGTKVWVRLRNRGRGTEKPQPVQLFAAPAATLVAPDHWRHLGEVTADVPQGDVLKLSASSVQWTADPSVTGSLPPGHRFALLAVLAGARHQLLPPGPPFFDWDGYRAFLRGPGVAMRNVHWVGLASPDLHVFLANAPDRPHAFAFEVVQRLPQGAQVTLDAHQDQALAAKMRQRQPWLGGGGASLILPQRPRTLIPRIELPAGYRQVVTFRVSPGTAPGSPPLAAGHSLALRQLWRGEEVGRITWLFGP